MKKLIHKLLASTLLSCMLCISVISYAEEPKPDFFDELDEEMERLREEQGIIYEEGYVRKICRELGYDPDKYIEEHYDEILKYGRGPILDELKKTREYEDYSEIVDGVLIVHQWNYLNVMGGCFLERITAMDPDTLEEKYQIHYKCCDGTYVCEYNGEENKEAALKQVLSGEQKTFALIDNLSADKSTDYYVDGEHKLSVKYTGKGENYGEEYISPSGEKLSGKDGSKLLIDFIDKKNDIVRKSNEENDIDVGAAIKNYVEPSLGNASYDVSKDILDTMDRVEAIAKVNSDNTEELAKTRELGSGKATISYNQQILAGHDEFKDEVSDFLLEYINDYRMQNGLEALDSSSVVLGNIAETRAKEITYLADEKHTRPDGSSLSDLAHVGELAAKLRFDAESVDSKTIAKKIFDSMFPKTDEASNAAILSDLLNSASIGVALTYDGKGYSVNVVASISSNSPKVFDEKYKDIDTSVKTPKYGYAVVAGHYVVNEETGKEEYVTYGNASVNAETGQMEGDGYYDYDNGEWYLMENGVVTEIGSPQNDMWRQRIVGAVQSFNGQMPVYVQTNKNYGGQYNISFIREDFAGITPPDPNQPYLTIVSDNIEHTKYRYVKITRIDIGFDGVYFVEIEGTNDPNDSGNIDFNDFGYYE